MQCYTKAINYERMNSGNQNQTNMMTLVANPIVEKCLTKMANEVTIQVRNKLIDIIIAVLTRECEDFDGEEVRRLIVAELEATPMTFALEKHAGVITKESKTKTMKVVELDADGNPITSNLADYAFISAAELPSFEVVHMETPTYLNPLGAKGIGESGTIGSTPAVQSAVIDAVAHLGIRHIDMPATSERVWRAIHTAR